MSVSREPINIQKYVNENEVSSINAMSVMKANDSEEEMTVL